MKYTFNLKEPKANRETLILFSCHFKSEGKKFVYSTGENILPIHWDFTIRNPKTVGKEKSVFCESIRKQLNRYSDLFLETISQYKRIGEDFNSIILRKVFDEEFKRTKVGKNTFYEAYDKFTVEKKNKKEWAPSTIKRYNNIKNILQNFEIKMNYAITFNTIDNKLHAEFTTYCMDDLKHINNTYARNLGLIKTFLYWALEEKYTFKKDFIKFKAVKKVVTKQIALNLEDLAKLLDHEFESKRLEKVRDVFVFACVTGMRFGELSSIGRSNVTDSDIILKETKNTEKPDRTIPLTTISRYLLNKYDYKLPLIANQKQNEYIKEVFQELEYNSKVQKVTTKGKENIKEELFFYQRISTHTARRTFITIMKRQGKSDKLIASMTGHTDMKTLNAYYQVDNPEKKEAMEEVFDLKIPLKVVGEN